MKIAFCFPSNKIQKLNRFLESFHHGAIKYHTNVICIAGERFKESDIKYSGKAELRFDKLPNERKIVNFCRVRNHSFMMAPDADIIITIDDDFQFTDGQSTVPKLSTADRYLDCIKYLRANEACSIVFAKSFLGGSPFGRQIVPMTHGGHFSTGSGMIMRAGRLPYIEKDLFRPGACEETAIGMTALVSGHFVAKAFNVPVRKDPSTKVTPIGTSLKNVMKGKASYDLGFVTSKGILGAIVKKYGSYTLGKKFPEGVIAQYRKEAKRKNLPIIM